MGVTLCCVSLPQSQGNNSKNSVVSSSSTKDSSMSSSAPMVPHLYLVSLLLIASFHCFPSFYRLVLSPHNLFVASHVKWNLFLVLCLIDHCLPLCFRFEHKLILAVNLMTLKLNDWLAPLSLSLLACVLPIPPWTHFHIFTRCITLTGRQMTFILQYNSRRFNQVLLNHILVTPLCVQLCHQSFVDALPLKWRLLPLHQKMTFHKLLFNFWMVNDGGFWVKQQPELTNEKQAIFLQEDAAPVFVGLSHLYNIQEFKRCLSQVG